MIAIPNVSRARGFVLVAVLLLIAVVSVVTVTVLQTTSTEIRISGIHRRTVQEFYAAEAGLAEARSRLRKTAGAEAYFVGDAGTWHDPLWTAYIAESADWAPSVDPEYSAHDTNVMPVPGNPGNTVVQPNSFQTDLPYWVKIRHKTEYDAERAGHDSATPHYVDLDGSRSHHGRRNRGNIVYFGYPSAAGRVPVSFTTNTATPWLPVERVVAHGAVKRGSVVLEEEVFHPPGPNHLGALYASGDVNLTGASGVIDGRDACGVVGSLPPVVYGGAFTSASTIRFDGNPASPRFSPHVLSLGEALGSLNVETVALNGDQVNRHLGTAQVPMTFLAESGSFVQPQGIRIRQTSGSGILLVDGNATLGGDVRWDGMILVTGTLFLDGHGSGIGIRGGVWAGRVDHRTGSLTVRYDSCLLQAALLAVPTRVRTWKEVF